MSEPKLKVYQIAVIERTIITVLVVAATKEEATAIVEDEDCQWYEEKEEVLDVTIKSPTLAKEYHDTEYAYYKDEHGVVHYTAIENILNQPSL